MGFRKLFNTLRGLFKTQPTMKLPAPVPFFKKEGGYIGCLKFQRTELPYTLIVHADFNGSKLKEEFERFPDSIPYQYRVALHNLVADGWRTLMAVVPVDRKTGLSLLLEQGKFTKFQEVFTLDIGSM